VNWSVDGVPGGNTTVGTVGSSGLYTPGTAVGSHTISGINSGNAALKVSATATVTDFAGYFTNRYNSARTGTNLQEYTLNPTSLNSGKFGLLWGCSLDGLVNAEPLYVSNLSIGGGVHNVLIVATMHDSVYAFDADNGSCTPYWKTSFLSNGVTTIPSTGCADTILEFGVTGTPVIDPTNNIIYMVADTLENSGASYVQRLHALNILTGSEMPGSPTQITATIQSTGVTFNPWYENQRAGLALSNGGVIITWGSHCDNTTWPWHGWVMRYDYDASTSTLSQTAVTTITPNGTLGGIWMSGNAPALDAEGNMFFSTGNGTFDAQANGSGTPNTDFSMSFLNMNPSSLAVQDFYTPSTYVTLNTADLDISAGGDLVLPDGLGPSGHPNVLVGTDKMAHMWLIDRTAMSGYVPGQDNTVQFLIMPNTTGNYAVHNSPAYWNGVLYESVANGPLMSIQLMNGLMPFSGSTVTISSQTAETYGYPPPTPTISASPSGGALAWALENVANGTNNGSHPLGPTILRAYDATNLATEYFSSPSAAGATGAAVNATKFISPVVANGHVYVVGNGGFSVFGLSSN
jgi:hypothetical protein